MARRAISDEVQKRFLDFWQRREGFGAPVGCIATTFTFNETFFELECLGRFVDVETDPAEDQLGYVVEREEKLGGITAAVFVDRHHAAEKRSLRWRQLAAGPAGAGILHAKVSLLVWKERIRVLVGSPNLTSNGYRKNFENLVAFDFTPAGETPKEFLDDVLKFLGWLARGDREGAPSSDSTRGRIADFISAVRGQAKAWEPGKWRPGDVTAYFAPVRHGGGSLFEQIGAKWRGTGPDVVQVVSPFWNDGAQGEKVVDSLLETMGKHRKRTIWFQATADRLPDGTVNFRLPAAYSKPWRDRLAHRFLPTNPEDEEGNRRDLHSKLIVLKRGDEAAFVLGSSNFTVAGTGCGTGGMACNIEANVIFVIPPAQGGFLRKCDHVLPPAGEELLAEDPKVRFLGARDEEEGLGPAADALPRRFGEALFEPAEGESGEQGAGALILELGAGEPTEFTVSDLGGPSIFEGTASGPSGTIHLAWAGVQVPSVLVVSWGPADDPKKAFWPVNVTDTSKLPPPQELRDLSYSEILHILSSDLPLQEALRQALGARGKVKPAIGSGVATPGLAELDPHRRLNTKGFLLRRVRAVSNAIEGLRERLARPAFCLEGLQWRLFGPVGPIALARTLRENEPAIAPFLIAELALALRSVNWDETDRYVGKTAREADLARLLSELERLCAVDGAETALEEYVRESFQEVLA